MDNDQTILTSFDLDDRNEIVLASKKTRFLAFLLDFFLILTFVFMASTHFIIPQFYPNSIEEFKEIVHKKAASDTSLSENMNDNLTPELKSMARTLQVFALISFWFYFAVSEILTKGASLGKRVFSITVINKYTLKPPSWIDSILRSGLKTLACLALFPLLYINFLFAFFTKKNTTGHDILTKTIVISAPKS